MKYKLDNLEVTDVDSAKFVSSGKPLNDDERMELQNQNIDKFYEDIMDKCIDYADMNYG
jgi:hypothetical protein